MDEVNGLFILYIVKKDVFLLLREPGNKRWKSKAPQRFEIYARRQLATATLHRFWGLLALNVTGTLSLRSAMLQTLWGRCGVLYCSVVEHRSAGSEKLGFYSLEKGFFYFMTELKIYHLSSFPIIYDTHHAPLFLLCHINKGNILISRVLGHDWFIA